MVRTGMILLATLCAAGAIASPITGERRLGAEEIRELTAGKTFHYEFLGSSRGAEQHFDDGRVVWQLPDGTCLRGVWQVAEEQLCYFYGEDRYGCWHVIETDTRIAHAPLDDEGVRSPGPMVFVNRISEENVGCAPLSLASL